jgi:hypothetical protein
MNTGIILTQLVFLTLLFYYQKKEKIYIGYTTVLCLCFGSVLVLALLDGLFFNASPTRLLMLSVAILGSVLIYVTSQLTLAFEKITQLSQALALKNLREQHPVHGVGEETPQRDKS